MWLITMPKGHKKARNVFKWYRTVSMLGTPPTPTFLLQPSALALQSTPDKALGSRLPLRASGPGIRFPGLI